MMTESTDPSVVPPVELSCAIESDDEEYACYVSSLGFPRVADEETGRVTSLKYVVNWDWGAPAPPAIRGVSARMPWGYSFAQCVRWRCAARGCLAQGFSEPMPDPESPEGRSFLFHGRYGHQEPMGAITVASFAAVKIATV